MRRRTAPGSPVRTCLGCGQRRPQDQLLRLHLDTEGRLRLGRSGPGRGGWICADDPATCLMVASKRRALDRAFRRSVDRASIGEVVAHLGPGPVVPEGS